MDTAEVSGGGMCCLGFSSMLVMTGSTVGPLVAGVLFDRLGDYELAFRVMAGAGLLGSVLYAVARPPRQS